MNVDALLKEALDDRDRLLEALAALERLARSRGWKRRGRPPKWLAEHLDEHAKEGRRSETPRTK